MNYFTLFDLPVSYPIDTTNLLAKYQQLQRQYHPDNVANGSDAEKLQAIRQSAMINDAYQTLKDPIKSISYFLALQGIKTEETTFHDLAFLTTQLELREELDGIVNQQEKSKQEDNLIAFSDKIAKMTKTEHQQLLTAIGQQEWTQADHQLHKLRFLHKLMEQAQQYEERLFES